MDPIDTFILEIWPKIPNVLGGVFILCLVAFFVWGIFFEKEKQPLSIPEPGDEPTFDPQETGKAIADAINEARDNDPSKHLEL